MLRSRGLRQGAWLCDCILINPPGCLLLLFCSFCAQLTPGLVSGRVWSRDHHAFSGVSERQHHHSMMMVAWKACEPIPVPDLTSDPPCLPAPDAAWLCVCVWSAWCSARSSCPPRPQVSERPVTRSCLPVASSLSSSPDCQPEQQQQQQE